MFKVPGGWKEQRLSLVHSEMLDYFVQLYGASDIFYPSGVIVHCSVYVTTFI